MFSFFKPSSSADEKNDTNSSFFGSMSRKSSIKRTKFGSFVANKKNNSGLRKASIGTPQRLSNLDDTDTQKELNRVFRSPSSINIAADSDPYGMFSDTKSLFKNPFSDFPSRFNLTDLSKPEPQLSVDTPKSDSFIIRPQPNRYSKSMAIGAFHNRLKNQESRSILKHSRSTTLDSEALYNSNESSTQSSLYDDLTPHATFLESPSANKASELLNTYSQRTLDPLINVKRQPVMASSISIQRSTSYKERNSGPEAKPLRPKMSLDLPKSSLSSVTVNAASEFSPISTEFDKFLDEKFELEPKLAEPTLKPEMPRKMSTTSMISESERKNRHEKFQSIYAHIKQKNSQIMVKSSNNSLNSQAKRHARTPSALDPILGESNESQINKKKVPDSLLQVTKHDKYQLLPDLGLSPINLEFDAEKVDKEN